MKSVVEQMQTILCPQPTREREDDRIVEIFLHAYRGGRFSREPNWLAQNRTNVEVIASDIDGVTLAIEHTRLFAFEDHKYKEEIFRPLAESLEAEDHWVPRNQCYWIRFRTDVLDCLSPKKREAYQQELKQWLLVTLPPLVPRSAPYKLACPKGNQSIPVEVEVWDRRPTLKGIYVSAYLPADPGRLIPIIRKALDQKAPKLAKAEARERLLLMEMPTISNSYREVINTVSLVGNEVPDFKEIDHLVVAKTFGYDQGQIYFFVWNRPDQTWTGYLKASLH